MYRYGFDVDIVTDDGEVRVLENEVALINHADLKRLGDVVCVYFRARSRRGSHHGEECKQARRPHQAGRRPRGRGGDPPLRPRPQERRPFARRPRPRGTGQPLRQIQKIQALAPAPRARIAPPRGSPRTRASGCGSWCCPEASVHSQDASAGFRLHDAADLRAIDQHVIVIVAPLAGRAGKRGALEDQRGQLYERHIHIRMVSVVIGAPSPSPPPPHAP